ncbi:ABC transporter substrate-binding protein [Hymenobacter crusticola]|uniref:ABC transporter substrate-binding protein n=1 Tax=Hymenobacter crusticola TaxID=1770526 RepID=A0A243WIR7_9BACT|nr:sugar ABC transporter substrate-binding protein [Hymenobacter crusticola]OUJ75766.1 ABC transporter substrate-binding protein [Hymenobacter crusticola]
MTPEPQTFRIAVRKFGPFESAMEKLWASFCEHLGCQLQAEMVPMDLHPLHTSLLTDNGLRKGTWDVAHINTDWLLEAYSAGALENIAPYLAQNPPADFPQGWSQSLLGMQQYGDDVAGLPFHDGPECLIYRKDLFEDPAEQAKFQRQHGKPLQPPQTWDDFHTVARFFHRPAQNRYGTIVAAYPDGHNTVFDFCLQLWSRGGKLVDAQGRVQINTPEAKAGLAFYRALLHDQTAIHPSSGTYESVQAGLAFMRGEAAMMINWFGFASMCEVDEASQVKGKVDITTIPQGEGGKPCSLNVYWLYAIGAGSQHKQTAYDFIRFAINPQNDKLLTLEGGIGCRLSTWHDAEINATVPYYHKLALLHEQAESLPQKSNWAQIAAIIDEVVLQATGTEHDIEKLLAAGQSKINSLEHV